MWYSFTFNSDGKAYCSFYILNPHYTTEQLDLQTSIDPWLSYEVFTMHIMHYCETEYITCYSWDLARLQYQGRVIHNRDILFKSVWLIMTKTTCNKHKGQHNLKHSWLSTEWGHHVTIMFPWASHFLLSCTFGRCWKSTVLLTVLTLLTYFPKCMQCGISRQANKSTSTNLPPDEQERERKGSPTRMADGQRWQHFSFWFSVLLCPWSDFLLPCSTSSMRWVPEKSNLSLLSKFLLNSRWSCRWLMKVKKESLHKQWHCFHVKVRQTSVAPVSIRCPLFNPKAALMGNLPNHAESRKENLHD